MITCINHLKINQTISNYNIIMFHTKGERPNKTLKECDLQHVCRVGIRIAPSFIDEGEKEILLPCIECSQRVFFKLRGW